MAACSHKPSCNFETRLRRCAVDMTIRMVSLGMLLVIYTHAGAANVGEYRLKAVFLYNFAEFVEWPPDALGDDDTPFIIGILGEDPFGTELDQTVRAESVDRHPIAVERFRSVADVGSCHILFISASLAPQVGVILDALHDRSILTVADSSGLERSGVMINLVTEAGRVRMRVNLSAARAARLTISSKLLRPAQIVSGNVR